MNTKLKLDLNRILEEANHEIDLLSYFVKLILRDYNIPVIINPHKVRHQPFEVESGKLEWTIDDNLIMEINYEH